MKRIIAMLAALLLIAAAVPAFAAPGSARLTLTGPSSAKVGDTVTVALDVSGEYQAHTFNIRVVYDNTSFRYLSKKTGEAYDAAVSGGGYGLIEPALSGNAISVGFIMFTAPMSAEGRLVELSFEVLPTAANEANFVVYVENFGYMPLGQTNDTPVSYTTQDCSIRLSGGTGVSTTLHPHESPVPTAVSDNTPTPPDGTVPPQATRVPDASDKSADDGHTGTIGTPDPNIETDKPGVTDLPGDATELPEGATEAPADATELPEGVTESPAETQQGGDTPGSRANAPKTGLIIGLCVLGAAVAAIVILLVIRNSRKVK